MVIISAQSAQSEVKPMPMSCELDYWNPEWIYSTDYKLEKQALLILTRTSNICNQMDDQFCSIRPIILGSYD